MMEYKGYQSKEEFDEESRTFHGEVIGLRDVVTFEAECGDDLVKAFHESVDDYLEFCAKRGEKPEKPFSGRLLLRLPPDLQRELYTQAVQANQSVNSFIVNLLQLALGESVPQEATSKFRLSAEELRRHLSRYVQSGVIQDWEGALGPYLVQSRNPADLADDLWRLSEIKRLFSQEPLKKPAEAAPRLAKKSESRR
jgi:predicted HicB family RNase H-like nuclease